jgi:GDP/UDP-N,N'-diacetylbacillosamine 2-epimerase (hydrolysing)
MPPQHPQTIAFFTGNRADYGLLRPLIQRLEVSPQWKVSVWAGGDHHRQGTIQELLGDQAPLSTHWQAEASGVFKAFALGTWANLSIDWVQAHQTLAAKALSQEAPDFLVVLGDRLEALGVAMAAFLSPQTVFIHLAGGDYTEGGCPDDRIRFVLSELAHGHGCFSASSKERLLKRGEEPWRIGQIGSPALDSALSLPLPSRERLCESFGWHPETPVLLFTQHPIASESEAQTLETFKACLQALERSGANVVATYPNQDAYAEALESLIQAQVIKALPNLRWIRSLGHTQYLAWVKACDGLIGNSSSGLYESTFWQKPSLSVGPRQKGRLAPANVRFAQPTLESLRQGIEDLLHDTHWQNTCKTLGQPYAGELPQQSCCQQFQSWLESAPKPEWLQPKRLTL